MKRVLRLVSAFFSMVGVLSFNAASAQISGTITIGGDINKYYVVTFKDGGAPANQTTELEIGRSDPHRDSSWRGTVIAKFRFHVNNWGCGSEFLDADIRQANSRIPAYGSFIGGWRDASFGNASANMIIWLRGKTTYTYYSNYPVSLVVYDGGAIGETYTPVTGFTYAPLTAVENRVNLAGMSYGHTAYFNGPGTNYYAGSLGIGTTVTGTSKLAVEGTIAARRIKVTQSGTWPDYVFEPEYKLPSLSELEAYIKANKHLPDVMIRSSALKN